MKLPIVSAVLASALLSQSATAQAAVEAPMPVLAVQPAPTAVLPANTEILLSTTQEITTKGDRWKEGDNFNLAVVNDVMFGPYVIIPKGSRGVGRIAWLTSKGAFGKSGKMDVELEYVEVGGRRIPVTGSYRQEGEGNTVATVGGVVLAGVFAGFVTGKSGRIPQGRELMARTKSDLPLALPASVSAVSAPPLVQAVVAPAPMQVASPVVPSVQPASVSNPVVQPVNATPASPTASAK